jgi:hypothetical protein
MAPKRTAVARECVRCGKTFTTLPSQIKRGGGRFCSRGCGEANRRRSLADRFFDGIGRKTPDGCIPWVKGRKNGWHGQIGEGGRSSNGARSLVASRVAYELFRGPIPAGLCVLHSCDNPACVNPTHLFLGTQADNVADMVAKGRQAVGERYGRSTLTADKVREIRRRSGEGECHVHLAAEFGLSKASITMIVQRKRWRHVV